jgi:hypothetical protein
VTVAEWLSCDDPRAMLAFLRGTGGDRKLRLFAAACARRAWSPDAGPAAAAALDAADRFADGEGTAAELATAWRAAAEAASEFVESHLNGAAGAAASACCEDAWTAAERAAERAAIAAQERSGPPPAARRRRGSGRRGPADEELGEEFELEGYFAEGRAQATLLRDVFGDPFCLPVAAPRWLTATAVSLARAIYAERAFDRLPILADALEDAGCDDPGLLAHLRGDGPHVRGCWAVDLVLGMQ